MRMSEYLNSIAPNTTRKFFTDIMYNYGIGVDEFEDKTLHGRLVEIRKYFGYSMTIPQSWTQGEVQADIKTMFQEYEELIIKYPDGVPNLMKRIKEMTNAEHTEYLNKHYTRLINVSLCNALIKGGPLQTVSLKDALISRVMTEKEVMMAEIAKKADKDAEFWNRLVNEFDKDELPPF